MGHGANDNGYFDDGSTTVGLDGTAHANMRHEIPLLAHSAWNRASATLYQHGGNMNTIEVKGNVLRHNQGDGEWYLYQKLLSFVDTIKGDLYIGGPTWIKYPNCFWVAGEGVVTCGTDDGDDAAYVDYSHVFIQSAGEKTEDLDNFTPGVEYGRFEVWSQGTPALLPSDSNPRQLEAWEGGLPYRVMEEISFSLPSEPAEYGGRNNNRTYTFGGTALGVGSNVGLKVSCSRLPAVNSIGRCYGVKIKDIIQGAMVQLEVPVAYDPATYPTRWQFEEWLHEWMNNFGDAPASLVGNGNTFTSCQPAGYDFAGRGQWEHLNPDSIVLRFARQAA